MNASTDQDDDHVWMLRMAIVACVLSFLSVYVTGRNQDVHEDGYTNHYDVVDHHLREACVAALFTVLCPTFGTLLEFIPFKQPKSKGEQDTQRQDIINSKLSKSTLALAEKSLFVIGILCLSVLYPTLPNTNADVLVRISVSFFNNSMSLMICAILCFLCRRSTSFSLWNTGIIVVLVCTSGVISSCALLYDDTHPTKANVLFVVSNVLFDVAGLIYAGSCLYSLIQWFQQSTSCGRKGNKVDDANVMDGQGKPNCAGGEEEAIKHMVLGTHMFSTFVVMTVRSVSRWFSPSLTVCQLTIVIYIMLGAALLVFVSDSYGRFRLTVAAMNALLDAKTDYVRYISHEIRTPLSATLMGLRLVLDDFKQSRPRPASVDADRLETLTDINSSCVAALDILNDLLCFNKLEAGLLEVHKEEVCPGAFVKESVALFNVQARDCGVNLSVVLNKPPNGEGDGDGNDDGVLGMSNTLANVISYRLIESDTISLDKFKIDQVIRNLVSNAIKFSPRGGAVTVYAYFDPEPLPVNHAVAGVAAQHTAQFSVEGQRGRRMSRASFLGQFTGKGSTNGGGSVVGSRSSLREKLVRVLSDRNSIVASPVPPIEGQQDDGFISSQAPVTTLGKLVVVVADHGPGISAENQKRLFKEVIQFSPEKLQAGGGSGFGLFITKSIVDLHDGAIGVYSAGEGKGTRFTLELPMSRIATAQSNNLPPGIGHAATATRSASLIRLATNTRAPPYAITAAVVPSMRTTRELHISRMITNMSAPAELNALGSSPAGGGVGGHPILPIDPRLEAVRQALNGHQQSLKDSIHSGSRHSSVSPGRPHSGSSGLKGSLMLRELSRMDALIPQSGSVSYSAGSKRGLFLGSPVVSIHNSRRMVFTAPSPKEGQVPAPVNVADVDSNANVPSATVVSSPKWDILVVDDSPLNRKMLVKILCAVGHSCEEAGNGKEGVEAVQRRIVALKTYDVVLMDFVMPVMDGPTAIRTLRTTHGYIGPVIGLTGNAMPADVDHFMAHGASAVLIKPIDMTIFNATMKQILAAK